MQHPKAQMSENKNNILKKILPIPIALSLTDRIIQFYKTVIELEQRKEPEIKTFYPYSCDEITPTDLLSIHLPQNEDFKKLFEENKQTRWSKDLLISFGFSLYGKNYNLFHYIIPHEELKDLDINKQPIQCKLSDFSINLKITEEFELQDEQISEIENAIKEYDSIAKIESALQNIIGNNLTMDNHLNLALSQKNPALLQIYSELNNLKNIRVGSLLSSFLLNTIENNQVDTLKEMDLIQVTELDSWQKKAVLCAFNNKLSVITGPPGCGKTQVILNILANAVLQNKKVLVASKNNKAVDNVKEKFDKIDDYWGYFLRFGSTQILSNFTIPAIDAIKNRIATQQDNTQELHSLKDKWNLLKEKITENQHILEEQSQLEDNIKKLERIICEAKEKQTQLTQKFREDSETLTKENQSFIFHASLTELNDFNAFLKARKNKIQTHYSGLGKLWFNWFQKRKYAFEILNTIEHYPSDIKNYLRNQTRLSQVFDLKNGKDIIILYQNLIEIFNTSINYHRTLSSLRKKYNEDHENLSIHIQTKEKEYQITSEKIKAISAQKADILQNIKTYEQQIKELGKPLLTATIRHLLGNKHNSIEQKIIDYRRYLPNNIPWKSEEIDRFTNSTKVFLDVFKITSVTNLSVKSAFPAQYELFDMVVIDEASQCDIASAIPLILRAKQLVVIGDPLQLKHISKVNNQEENTIKEHLSLTEQTFLNYNSQSLWDYCNDLLIKTGMQAVILNKHYRCHPHIIGYSNETFYHKQLGTQLEICTKDQDYKRTPKGIVWINVKGKQKTDNININDAEVNKAVEIAVNLIKKDKDLEIGIVTPFKDQAEQLNAKIPTQYKSQIIADTVHKFQGDEKDVMIYSLVVSDNSPENKIYWIDKKMPNLINVAVTRARNTLYVIGNREYIQKMSPPSNPLGHLIEYIDKTTPNLPDNEFIPGTTASTF